MAILVFILSVVLLVAGAASGYASLDLLPTSDGVLYALGAAVAVSASIVTFALGALIRRIDSLARLMRQSVSPAIVNIAPESETAPAEEAFTAPPVIEAEAPESVGEAPAPEDESPININRAGHLPTLGETESALETPEATPSLVGRYSSGGANYLIFNDGSIEAELSDGTFKFASMSEFKRYLVEREGQGKVS
jgi:hypothetical protein